MENFKISRIFDENIVDLADKLEDSIEFKKALESIEKAAEGLIDKLKQETSCLIDLYSIVEVIEGRFICLRGRVVDAYIWRWRISMYCKMG